MWAAGGRNHRLTGLSCPGALVLSRLLQSDLPYFHQCDSPEPPLKLEHQDEAVRRGSPYSALSWPEEAQAGGPENNTGIKMTKSKLGLGVHSCETEAGKWRVLDQPELQSETRKGGGEDAVDRSPQSLSVLVK